jgi:protein subunit release factor A
MSEKSMTKTEVRRYLKRIREGAAWAEEALKANDPEDLKAAVLEIGGSAGEIESALSDGYDHTSAAGIRGMVRSPDRVSHMHPEES